MMKEKKKKKLKKKMKTRTHYQRLEPLHFLKWTIELVVIWMIETAKFSGASQRPGAPTPPKLLEFVLTMGATTPKLEGELGCINELFEREVETLGVRRAKLRYWGKGIRLLFKIVKPLMARAVKWGVIADLFRRFIP